MSLRAAILMGEGEWGMWDGGNDASHETADVAH